MCGPRLHLLHHRRLRRLADPHAERHAILVVEPVVRGLDNLEGRLRAVVALVLVRVDLDREPPVRTSHLLGRRLVVEAEHLEGVPAEGARRVVREEAVAGRRRGGGRAAGGGGAAAWARAHVEVFGARPVQPGNVLGARECGDLGLVLQHLHLLHKLIQLGVHGLLTLRDEGDSPAHESAPEEDGALLSSTPA